MTMGVSDPVYSRNYLQMLTSYEWVSSEGRPFGYGTADCCNSVLLSVKCKKNV